MHLDWSHGFHLYRFWTGAAINVHWVVCAKGLLLHVWYSHVDIDVLSYVDIDVLSYFHFLCVDVHVCLFLTVFSSNCSLTYTTLSCSSSTGIFKMPSSTPTTLVVKLPGQIRRGHHTRLQMVSRLVTFIPVTVAAWHLDQHMTKLINHANIFSLTAVTRLIGC